MPTPKPRKPIPFSFALEALERVKPFTRPMFGAYGVYVGELFVLVLYEKDKHPDDSGVWISTTAEHHESLRREIPSLRSLKLFGEGPTDTQIIPSSSPNFEEEVLHACKLILKRDPRVGRIPKKKKKSLAPKRKKKK